MKRLAAIILIIATIFSLGGCMGNFHQPVESTPLEATTVMSFEIDGIRYDMRFELYRFFFLNYKSRIDGGDSSAWSGEKRAEYISEIEEIIIDRALDIFSVFALARRAGIDPYSADVGKKINDYINASIKEFPSYEDYLKYLKKNNINYSVQELLFRYGVVLELVEDYYIGAGTSAELAEPFFEPGALEYTAEDVESFYFSEGCARILRWTVEDGAFSDTAKKAAEIREKMLKQTTEFGIASIIANNSLTDGPEIERGYFLGKYNLNDNIHGALVSAAFGLKIGEVSEVIRMHDGEKFFYHIIYRAEKSEENFTENKTDITFVYLTNELGKMQHEIAEEMSKSSVRQAFLESLDYSGISMEM